MNNVHYICLIKIYMENKKEIQGKRVRQFFIDATKEILKS